MNIKIKINKEATALAFIIPFIICFFILFFSGVYPFGDRCILHIDMYHQYCPFMTEFLNKIKNGGNFQYTWNSGLGSDFVALYAYYLASPLNIFLIFCSKAHVIEFMTLLIVVKISLASMFMFLFIKEHYCIVGKDGSIHEKMLLLSLVAALAYSFCGFTAAYNWNIMWLDSFALLPAICIGMDNIIKKCNPLVYFVTLSIAIWSNYYIAIMICIFAVLYFLTIWAEDENNYLKSVFQFAIFSLLSGGTAAVLIIPELKILRYSGSSGINIPEKSEWYFNFISEVTRMSSTAYAYTGDDHWPNIYTGAFAIFLIFAYILNKRIKIWRKIPRIFMVGFFFASFSNNILDFIWHGLHYPDSLPSRQSFLFSFLVICMCYETVIKFNGLKRKDIITSAFMAIIILVVGLINNDGTVTDSLAIGITIAYTVSYSILGILRKSVSKKYGKIFLEIACLIAVVDLSMNMAVTSFYTVSRSQYLSKMESYEKLLSKVDEKENGNFYRVEQEERMSKNDDALYGYHSTTQFSSLMNINVSHFYQKNDMEGGKNFYCYNGATPLLSAMLSVKYCLSDDPNGDDKLKQRVDNIGEQYLYKNKYVLPIGFTMTQKQDKAWNTEEYSSVSSINMLAESLNAENENKDQKLLFDSGNLQNSKPGETIIKVRNPGHLYAQYSSCYSDELYEEIEGRRNRTFSKTSHVYLLDLGEVRLGDEVKIKNDNQEKLVFNTYLLNEKVLSTACETLTEDKFKTEVVKDTYIRGKVNLKKDKNLVFSIPNEEGWKVYVDGQKIKSQSFKTTFIKIPLKKGKHKVELRYETPGLVFGGFISFVSLALGILLLVLQRVYQKKHNKNDM